MITCALLVLPYLAGAAPHRAARDPVQSTSVGVTNWGLDRIDQPLGLDGRFTSIGTGKGVHIYIIDTGVTDRMGATIFPEFADPTGRSRIIERRDTANGSDPGDCDTKYSGHGTRVASLAAGLAFGVARDALVHSLRACDADPARQFRAITAALNSIASAAEHSVEPTRVINISFTLPSSDDLKRAIQRAMDAGFVFTVSAGCRDDTARTFGGLADPQFQTQGFLIVAGTDSEDRTFRNYGNHVTLYAPATRTSSVDTRGNGSVPPLVSDRPPEHCADSWAAPHAAGVAAAYLGRHQTASPREVYQALMASTVRGVVTLDGVTVPGPSNRLLQIVRD